MSFFLRHTLFRYFLTVLLSQRVSPDRQFTTKGWTVKLKLFHARFARSRAARVVPYFMLANLKPKQASSGLSEERNLKYFEQAEDSVRGLLEGDTDHHFGGP